MCSQITFLSGERKPYDFVGLKKNALEHSGTMIIKTCISANIAYGGLTQMVGILLSSDVIEPQLPQWVEYKHAVIIIPSSN